MKDLLRWQKILLVLVFGVIGFFYFRDLKNQSMHIDEHEWVRRGMIFYEAYFVDHNYSRELWESYEAIDQPKLGEYFYGAWLKLVYREDLDDLVNRTRFNGDWEKDNPQSSVWENKHWWIGNSNKRVSQYERIPNEYRSAYEILVTSRILSVVFGMGSLGLLFILLKNEWDYYHGLLGVIFLAINPLYFSVIRTALLDGMVLFWMMYFLVVLVHFVRRVFSESKIRLFDYFGLAIGFGFGSSVKLNGLMVFVGGWLLLLACLFLYKRVGVDRVIRLIKSVGLAMVGGVLVYILIHPMLWKQPFEIFGEMYASRTLAVRWHAENFQHLVMDGYGKRVLNLLYYGIGRLGFYPGVGMMFMILLGVVEVLWSRKTLSRGLIYGWYVIVIGFMLWYLKVSFYWHYSLISPLYALLGSLGTIRMYNLMREIIGK